MGKGETPAETARETGESVSDGLLSVAEFARSLWLGQFLADLGIYSVVFEYVPEFVALAILVGTIVGVGSLAHVRYGERIVVAVDSALADVPGLGTVYKSFRRVGDAMLGSEAENFEDVKIVEYPREGSYILGYADASLGNIPGVEHEQDTPAKAD